MKVLAVWDDDYPWDVRVEKTGSALRDAGHEVHLAARNRAGQATREEVGPFVVHRLSALRVANEPLGFPAFFNPRWVRHIDSLALRLRPDLILVRDLPLAPTAIYVGRRRRVPVVLDMAENYPALLRDIWREPGFHWPDLVVRNPRLATWVERWVLARVAHVLVVVEESRRRLVELGVPGSRLTVVSNTPPLASLDEQAADARTEPPVAVYLGVLEDHRGLETTIRAIAAIRDLGGPWRLKVLGSGHSEARFRELAAQLSLADRIRFHGWVDPAESRGQLRTSQAGLIPHHTTEAWNTTIPNKLFDYMAAGIPVVASGAPPVARLLRETRAGRVFRDRDASDLARVLMELGPVTRETLGAAGRTAIRERYNWERDAERMLSALGAVAARSASSPAPRGA